MRAYFEKVKKGLTKDGVFLLDAYGGWESHQPQIERSKKGGFTYVWDQHKYDPITHSIENHIHFEFPDGTKQHRAFSYYWRFWSLPELTELLTEAGLQGRARLLGHEPQRGVGRLQAAYSRRKPARLVGLPFRQGLI